MIPEGNEDEMDSRASSFVINPGAGSGSGTMVVGAASSAAGGRGGVATALAAAKAADTTVVISSDSDRRGTDRPTIVTVGRTNNNNVVTKDDQRRLKQPGRRKEEPPAAQLSIPGQVASNSFRRDGSTTPERGLPATSSAVAAGSGNGPTAVKHTSWRYAIKGATTAATAAAVAAAAAAASKPSKAARIVGADVEDEDEPEDSHDEDDEAAVVVDTDNHGMSGQIHVPPPLSPRESASGGGQARSPPNATDASFGSGQSDAQVAGAVKAKVDTPQSVTASGQAAA
jgi:hypothetical protein